MNRKNLIFFFVGVVFLVGACSLTSVANQSATQSPLPQGNPSQPGTAIQPTLSGGNGQSGFQAATQTPLSRGPKQSGTQTNVQVSFPVAPDSQMDSSDSGELNDTSGSFNIHSQATIEAVIKYYTDELPKQGWTLRYSDPNVRGGVTQYWKKDNIYISLDFGYADGELTIRGEYDRVETQAVQKLPTDFPLPDQAEMVKAEDSSWEFYIPQDYADVTNFYQQKLTSLDWIQVPPVGAGGIGVGSCGDTDCGGSGYTFPPGITPMPAPTIDPRNENHLSFTMPDGNEIDLTIDPHQNGTILYVDETLKNVESAGLPTDVPIYPGATVQMITPGMANFQINADINTIENYYIDQLKAAGWTPDGNPIEVSGSYLQNWIKGNQSVQITLVPSGDSIYLTINCSSCIP